MRLLRFLGQDGPEFGLIDEEQVFPLGPVDITDLPVRSKDSTSHFLGDVSLLPPVDRPSKVIGVGMNYRSFIEQLNEEPPAHPVLFHKTSSALTASGLPIVIPPVTDRAVPEGELAVVLGRTAWNLAEDDVDAHLLGYTCANDVSARNLEFRTSQWTSGKMLPTFCPLGPWLVTPDEFGDPGNVTVRTFLNGALIQEGDTADMIFGVRRLVSEISFLVRLEPGDVILTGTPSDLGELPEPVFLRPGDTVSVEIDRIGRLENPVCQA
jgi:2-keto-4-pentenoate hydratase/2-oxohepta-3-ene-1,7-dioic acid hydratase in catechol pathway